MKRRNRTRQVAFVVTAALMAAGISGCNVNVNMNGSPIDLTEGTGKVEQREPVIAEGLPEFSVEGSSDLPGNFFLSFVYTRNLIMLDGQGNIVWSKHEEQPEEGLHTGLWDFKQHVIDGKTYYSYHDQIASYDGYGLEGYAPGERVIMDEDFNEIKRITFEESDVVKKGDPLDGHDFLMLDPDHYILSGYIKDTVYNHPDHPEGSSVVYSYLQEVKDGSVVWEFKSIDYPELYDLVVKDGSETADDFANESTDVPDIIHFNSMRLDDNGDLICSFRHISSLLCLDRSKSEDQIKWKLSGGGDEFGLSDDQKTSCQHYATIDGDYITVFDNGNSSETTHIRSYEIDPENRELKEMKTFDVPGKYSSACGNVQHISDDTYVIGWGRSMNDPVCMSVYDFASGEEKMSVSLKNPVNFTYRCVYYGPDGTSANNFPSWNPDSGSLKELVDFVSATTDRSSPDYLDPADRIAVFDMDGTILCEKAPVYIDFCLTMHRVLDDPSYKASEEEINAMQQIRDHAYSNGEVFNPEGLNKNDIVASAFAGMTPKEFREYVVDFADKTDAVGFSGMTYSQSFYKPMIEVIEYLKANDYDVWMVSACEREVVRALVERYDIPYDHVIATDVPYVASGKGDEAADEYNMSKEDEILLGAPLDEVECGKSGKPAAIAREIGKYPVLAFGNSSGDYSMLNYAEGNPEHTGMGFFIVCDDTEREYGSEEKAAEYYNVVEEQGWTPFSMANDWKTIYGDDVEKTELPGTEEELPNAA